MPGHGCRVDACSSCSSFDDLGDRICAHRSIADVTGYWSEDRPCFDASSDKPVGKGCNRVEIGVTSARLSPTGHQHMNFLGRYEFSNQPTHSPADTGH